MTTSQQYAFVHRFFDSPRQRMSRKRFRHWKRQQLRGAQQGFKDLEPITTIQGPLAQHRMNQQMKHPQDHEDFEEHRPYCFRCSNTGSINCFCGGDLCVCSNNGEYPCPDCGYD